MQFLNDMVLFVEVAKTGSFTQAADNLAMSKSTLSERISRLEKQIGLRLLNRTTRKVELTEAGLLYFEQASQIVQQAEMAYQKLDNLLKEPNGELKISVPVDFTYEYLAPHLAEFCLKYPKINLNFDLTPRRVDLIKEAYDLAIRVGELSDSNLIQRLICRSETHLFASPDYLAKHGEPQSIDDLTRHQCLAYPFLAEWLLSNGKQSVNIATHEQVKSNNLGLNLRLAIQGFGIVLLPDQIAKNAVGQGQLVQILPEWHRIAIPVYALTTTNLLPAKTQVFIEFLREKLAG